MRDKRAERRSTVANRAHSTRDLESGDIVRRPLTTESSYSSSFANAIYDDDHDSAPCCFPLKIMLLLGLLSLGFVLYTKKKLSEVVAENGD